LIQFFELNILNQEVLADIIARHELTAKWKSFQKQFLMS
jgi:hypothetical protein